MHGEVVLVADTSEVEHHRQSEELVAYPSHHGTATGDDGLGERVVQRYFGFANGHRGVAVDDERGQGGNMQQPVLRRHVVVAITSTDTNVRHLKLKLLIIMYSAVLSLPRRSQQETAGRTPLDVTLGKGGWIREATTVEYIEGIHIQRLQCQQVFGQFHTLLAVRIMPSGKVLSILIDDVEAETLAVRVEIQFVVALLSHQFGGIECRTKRKA